MDFSLSGMRRAVAGFIHTGTGRRDWDFLPGTKYNYENDVVPMLNSAVASTVFWMARNFSEAPLAVWDEDENGELSIDKDSPVTQLIRKPNPYYSGSLLWFSTMIEFVVSGNAYWVKERNADGTIKHLWWVPKSLITPISHPNASDEFILGYKYAPGGDPMLLLPEDVVHIKYGLDPDDQRLGLGPLGSLIREIATDDQASNFTATLMRNSAVPGMMMTPEKGVTFDKQTRDEAKSRWNQSFGGDRSGGLMVASGAMKVTPVGIEPDKLNLAAIRQIPEERVTAVLGIPAAVIGLGTGLETTKVGATLAGYREQAWENCLIPIGRMISEQIDDQLLDDFNEEQVAAFDYRRVRTLQQDESDLATRVENLAKAGLIKISQAQAMLGYPVDETQDFYVRNTLVFQPVRSGEDALTPEEVLLGDTNGDSDNTPTDEVDDGEKDYPDFMRQVDRVAIEADKR